MRTNFVLIDSENVKPEYLERLKQEHFHVVVFVGATLQRLDFPIAKAMQSLGSNGSYVQISGNGPNALDFHIARFTSSSFQRIKRFRLRRPLQNSGCPRLARGRLRVGCYRKRGKTIC